MTHTLSRNAVGAGLVLLTVLAGCSSSGGDDGNSPGGTTSSTGGRAPNPATATAIKRAYRLFFDSTGPTSQGVATLQHGAKFRSTIVSESKSSFGKQKTSATVSTLQLVNKNVAHVTFTIKVGGQTMLPDSPGLAVREAGKWKVAAQTFCNLLKAEGTAPPLCKNKSITALPG